MAKVYSTLPTFAIEEEKKEESVKLGSIPKAKKIGSFFSYFSNPFEKSHKSEVEKQKGKKEPNAEICE